jgi:D-glycero-alpha-D-manno-heptose 1-phosphate guanylyltransferase
MHAIVLAGGFGTRLQSVVSDVPKPMALVGGRPFLEILLCHLERLGFDRVTMSVGYLSHLIVNHFGPKFGGMQLTYAVEPAPLGTGGAVVLAQRECADHHVFVFNGDTYLDFDARAVEALWRRKGNPIVMACQVGDTARYGRLLVEGDRVRGFSEKGASGPGLINAGAYLLDLRDLAAWPEGVKFSLEQDYLVPAATTREINCYADTENFVDIGVPDDYFRAEAVIVRRI